jgi:hypothetical protein
MLFFYTSEISGYFKKGNDKVKLARLAPFVIIDIRGNALGGPFHLA